MRKLLTIMLLTACMQAAAQYRNGITATYQPMDAGWGATYARYFIVDTAYTDANTLGERRAIPFARLGVYVAYAHGNYIYPNVTIKDHNRYEAGISWAVWPPYVDEKIYTCFTAGVVFHTFGESTFELYRFNMYALEPISATVGVVNRFNRITFGIRYDPFKQESCIDLGCLF